jgi:hypothetical protein
MSRYLDAVNRVAQAHAHAKTAKSAKSDFEPARQFSQSHSPYPTVRGPRRCAT